MNSLSSFVGSEPKAPACICPMASLSAPSPSHAINVTLKTTRLDPSNLGHLRCDGFILNNAKTLDPKVSLVDRINNLHRVANHSRKVVRSLERAPDCDKTRIAIRSSRCSRTTPYAAQSYVPAGRIRYYKTLLECVEQEQW